MSTIFESQSSNPVRSLTISLWNANGLRATTVQDVLSHTLTSDILFVTETFLLSGYFPTDEYTQFHVYGTRVNNSSQNRRGRGQDGITAFVSPHCPFPVTQLPSYNAYTLSLRVGSVTMHCCYFPPRLPDSLVLPALRSIPLGSDTIICGDFNGRLGDVLGDKIMTPRGADLASWCLERNLQILNATLAFGVNTYSTFRNKQKCVSIIDLFITNIPSWNMASPQIMVYEDLSLSSDHRLLTLSFTYDPTLGSGGSRNDSIAQRRLWNLSLLAKPGYVPKLQSKFKAMVTPLVDSLSCHVSSPGFVRPDIDSLNHSLNDCLYQTFDTVLGPRVSHSGKRWKKYWTPEMQAAARERDRCFGKWHHTVGADKCYWWRKHREAQKVFRNLVSAAKRLSWQQFCASLEKDPAKAISALAKIKRRRQCSSTYAHADGPQASVDAMASHLSSVYNGSLLPDSSTRPPPPMDVIGHVPFPLPADVPFSPDMVADHIKRLPKRKAPGSDHLKAEMLHAISAELAPVLSLLFSLCYQWAYTPRLWRTACVFPIHKKGDPTDPANYRPISLTSVMRKLFEFNLSDFLTAHSPPLDVAQGGFRPQRSPLDQALCLHDLMIDYTRTNHRRPVVAFLDIKAAYDTVDRRVIWAILAESSLPRPVLALLVNMFDDVHISVLIANHTSAPFSPATGVLQGSVLSPHLYSLYINSLPRLLRSVASRGTTSITTPDSTGPTPLNCLLFADDVAIFGSHSQVQQMLNLAASHSHELGYRWSPSKCAILNAPSSGTPLSLYGSVLPTVDEFVYLGVPFRSSGLYGPGILALRKASAVKTMALLVSVGAHRNGFALLLSSRLYTCFIRPKIEYGLAISNLSGADLKHFDDVQNKLVSMFIGGSWFNVAKHITCLPPMQHRYNTLVTRFVNRAKYLPEDSLVVLLQTLPRPPRLIGFLQNNPLYRSLPRSSEPLPDVVLRGIIRQYRQTEFDNQMAKAVTTGHHVLVRACRPCTSKPDPILTLPMQRSARSRLVRWRLGRFANLREECPCLSGEFITRFHYTTCRAIDPALWDEMPVSPQPGVHPIDAAINGLPEKATHGPPPYWSALLQLLYAIDCLRHPAASIPPDPDPGNRWLPPSSPSS